MSKSRIAIFGSGGTGSNIGADLVRESYDVVFIDQWPAHVEVMKAKGLCIMMPGPGNDHDHRVEFRVPTRAFHICEVCTLKGQFDIVFLACKSYDSRWMVELIKPYLKPDGVLVSTQCGLNNDWIAPMVGYERDIACALELSSAVLEPGLIQRNTDRHTSFFAVGRLDGKITPRLQEVVEILSAVGRAEVTTNIRGYKWTKIVSNSQNGALCAISGVKAWDLTQNPKYLGFTVRLASEAVRVSKALGIILEPILGLSKEQLASPGDEELKMLLLNLVSDLGRATRTAALQDVSKGRLTEIDYVNGLVVRTGREMNVPTPLNEAVNSQVKQIEQGKLKQSLLNLEMLDKYQ
jgi:2-dehydropantoate 2-reductase